MLSQVSPNFINKILQFAQTQTIKNIFNEINQTNWNAAKQLWILNIINLNKQEAKSNIDLFGTESVKFLKHVKYFLKLIA